MELKEKLKTTLDYYEQYIKREEEKIENLTSQIKFCRDHNLEEELRITRLKLESIEKIIHRWRNQQNALRELIGKDVNDIDVVDIKK